MKIPKRGKKGSSPWGACISLILYLSSHICIPHLSLIFSQPVTTLCISLTSSLLLAGTSAGLINIYDIPSHQPLRTISTHKGFSITHLATMLKPPDLVGHVSLNLNLGAGGGVDPKDVMNVRPVVPFHRMRDAKAREKHEVTMMLPAQDMVRLSHRLIHPRMNPFLAPRYTKMKQCLTPPRNSFATTLSSSNHPYPHPRPQPLQTHCPCNPK